MKPTKAQRRLLEQLENGYELTLQDGYYTVVTASGDKVDRVWPSTFHGLFNYGAVQRNDDGNYVLSERGSELLGA